MNTTELPDPVMPDAALTQRDADAFARLAARMAATEGRAAEMADADKLLKGGKTRPKQPAEAGETPPKLTFTRCLADVRPERTTWLWPGRIARGKLTVLAGDPGLGKSQLTTSLAAIVSTGGLWPVDRTRADIGSVIVLSAEDDVADTILPRMLAAGADVGKVHVLDAVRCAGHHGEPGERAFDLTRDIGALSDLLARVGDTALVVIDPITAYLGAVDSHRNAEVRGALAPLSVMAARFGVAVVIVTHLNKGSGGSALSRVTGSGAFTAAPRSGWLVAKDPRDPARRLFLNVKNNIGPDGSATGLAFRVESATVDDGIETSRVSWDSERVAMTADEALAATGGIGSASDASDGAPQREEAEDWLLEALAVGPVASEKLKSMARVDGVAWRTVERAKDALGVRAKKGGFGAKAPWVWMLPDAIDRQFPHDPDYVAAFGDGDNENGIAMRLSPKAANVETGGGLRAQDGGLHGGGGLRGSEPKTATERELGGLRGNDASTPFFYDERPKAATKTERGADGGLRADGVTPAASRPCTPAEYAAAKDWRDDV